MRCTYTPRKKTDAGRQAHGPEEFYLPVWLLKNINRQKKKKNKRLWAFKGINCRHSRSSIVLQRQEKQIRRLNKDSLRVASSRRNKQTQKKIKKKKGNDETLAIPAEAQLGAAGVLKEEAE